MKLGDPNVELVFGQVWNISRQGGGVVMHRFASKDPTHVRPPFAVNRRMRVAVYVRKLVVDAVGGHPENWTAFERHGGAYGHEIFHPLGGLVAAVGQQAVVTHADAHAGGKPPEKHRHEERLPAKEKERSNRADMEDGHEGGRHPLNIASVRCLSI